MTDAKQSTAQAKTVVERELEFHCFLLRINTMEGDYLDEFSRQLTEAMDQARREGMEAAWKHCLMSVEMIVQDGYPYTKKMLLENIREAKGGIGG